MNTTATATTDAIALLKADHREAESLFKEYEQLKEAGKTQEKFAVATKVCDALLIHMEIEEKLFYPQVRGQIDEDDMMNEALVEHAGAKDLIKQLGSMKPDDPMFDAKVKVLSDQIEHHVKEEEKEMFPEAKKSNINLKELGEKLLESKNKLVLKHQKSQ
jgi:hypothetical protein